MNRKEKLAIYQLKLLFSENYLTDLLKGSKGKLTNGEITERELILYKMGYHDAIKYMEISD